jgi:hypothetical protein
MMRKMPRASHRIRDVVSLSAHLDRVEAIHSEIVAAGQPPPDRANDLRELGAFIARWLCRLGEGIVPENFEVLSAANTAQRQFEAERLNYLQQIRVLNDACVDRLELINELSGQCEARLEVINKLDAALKLSDEVLAKKQADTIRRYGQVVRVGPFMLGISVES